MIPEYEQHTFERGGYFAVEVVPNKLAVISLNTLYWLTLQHKLLLIIGSVVTPPPMAAPTNPNQEANNSNGYGTLPPTLLSPILTSQRTINRIP
jgi:hypothetical protein